MVYSITTVPVAASTYGAYSVFGVYDTVTVSPAVCVPTVTVIDVRKSNVSSVNDNIPI